MSKLILPRRKLLLGACASLITSPAIIRQAMAQVPMTRAGKGVPGAAAAAAWSPNATAIVNDEAFSSSTSTFNLTLTTAATDTVIVIVSTSIRAITGVTVGGNSMTQSVLTTGTGGSVGIWYLVGAYTNPSVVVSAGVAFQYVGCSYGKWTGASATPSGTTAQINLGFNADPNLLSSLTVPSGGVLIAGCGAAVTSGITWDNISVDASAYNAGSWGHSSAHYSTAGAIQASQSGTAFVGNADAAITIGP